jgi:cell division transport system permease protein
VKLLIATGQALRTALADLARRPLSALISVLAMGLALFLLATFLSASRGIDAVLLKLGEQAVIEVYLLPDATDQQISLATNALQSDARVARLETITPQRALTEFRSLYPDLGDIEGQLGGNPFPPSLRVWPASSESALVAALVETAKQQPAVEAVRYDQEWISALSEATRAASWIALGGALVLLLAAWTIVGAVVRLALDDKREEVALMRLVGASVSFVVAPVLIAGGVLGGIGGVIAVQAAGWLRSAIVSWSAATPLAGFTTLVMGQGLTTDQIVSLIVFGIGSGVAAAGLAAGRASLR